MLLLDRAVKMAAELDEPEEMNFVRKHAKQQAAELGLQSIRDAATRIFSNRWAPVTGALPMLQPLLVFACGCPHLGPAWPAFVMLSPGRE